MFITEKPKYAKGDKIIKVEKFQFFFFFLENASNK